MARRILGWPQAGLVALAAVSPACGPRCGAGTHEEGGECVADTDTDADTDADTDTDTDTDADWTVCVDGTAPFTQVQDAVDAAAAGDVVRICPGLYAGVTIAAADVSLSGAGADTTTLFSSTGPALTIRGVSSTVTGLSLRGSAPDGQGGGLYLAEGADATVSDVAFTENPGPHVVWAQASSATFDHVLFADNTISGSLFFGVESDVTMRHSTLRDNAVGWVAYTNVTRFDFTNNVVANTSFGGTAFFQINNTASVTENNVFYELDQSENIPGHVIDVTGDFRNNIVMNSSSRDSIIGFPDGTYAYNDFFGNSGQPEGATFLNADPKFTDAAGGDFTLKAGFSPCIDAGDPLARYEDADGSRNDLGAFGGPSGAW